MVWYPEPVYDNVVVVYDNAVVAIIALHELRDHLPRNLGGLEEGRSRLTATMDNYYSTCSGSSCTAGP